MNKDKWIFTVGFIAFLLLTLASCGLFYFNFNRPNLNNKKEITAIKSPAPVTINAKKSDYKDKEIEVLNATKTKGLAKIYADKLILMGYSKVTAGNYQEILGSNILYAPSDFKEELTKVGFDNYEFIKSNNIKIIIGK